MRISSATMGLWLLAAGCGGHGGGAESTAGSSHGSVGSESERPPRASAAFTDEESMSRQEIAMETPGVPPEAMPETESVAEAGGAAAESAGVLAPEVADRSARTGGTGSGEPIPSPFAESIAPPEGAPQERTTCPADVEGLEVRVASVPRGGALVFRVAADEEETLRARLRLFAKIHEAQRIAAAGGPPPVQKPEATAGAEAQAIEATGPVQPKLEENPPEQRFADADALIHQASEVRMVEAPGGARLEVRVGDARRVRDLRSELRADAEQLAAGTCPLALSVES